jgi:hypothetical protein
MSKNPEKELEEFLAPLPPWLQAALEEKDYLFSSVEENLEGINNQDRVIELRPEYERILRQIPAQWNEYSKRFRDNLRKTHETEEQFLKVPKGIAGAPRNDALAREAFALRQAGRNLPQVAAELSKKYKKSISPEAVRKLIKRLPTRTN